MGFRRSAQRARPCDPRTLSDARRSTSSIRTTSRRSRNAWPACSEIPDAVSAPVDIRLRCADGTYRWFEASGSNRLDDPSIRGLVISLRNTTDRRAADVALRMSEERNRSIVEAAADAIISIDTQGIIQSFNRAAEHIFATRAVDAIGKSYDTFLPEDSLRIRAPRARGRTRRPPDRHDRLPRIRRTLRRARRRVGGAGRRHEVLHGGRARHQQPARDGAGPAGRGIVRRADRPAESPHIARSNPGRDRGRAPHRRRGRNGVRRPRPIQARQRWSRPRRRRPTSRARGRSDRGRDPTPGRRGPPRKRRVRRAVPERLRSRRDQGGRRPHRRSADRCVPGRGQRGLRRGVARRFGQHRRRDPAGAAAVRRHCDVPRQGGRHVAGRGIRHAHAAARGPAARRRVRAPASDQSPRAARVLPADRRSRHRTRRQSRGAHSLGSARCRHHPARQLHPDRRRSRDHHGDRRVDDALRDRSTAHIGRALRRASACR